jgi:hypothetical protein
MTHFPGCMVDQTPADARQSGMASQGTGPAPVGGGFVPWLPTGAPGTGIPASLPDNDLLDPPVRPLVEALNRTGWARTVFSCGGHPEEPDAVARGRRQAHVDVVVSDRRQWSAWVRHVKRAVPEAIQRIADQDGPGRDGTRIRIAEGGLGPLPTWLAEALAPHTPGGVPEPGPFIRGLARVAILLDLPWLPDATTPWRYRRLVLEPVPYGMDANQCRKALDVAIGIATECLARLSPGAR